MVKMQTQANITQGVCAVIAKLRQQDLDLPALGWFFNTAAYSPANWEDCEREGKVRSLWFMGTHQ